MRITVDRIEGDFAVLDIDQQKVDFPLVALPEGTREGTVLAFRIVDGKELLDEAEARLKRLRASGPKSDDIEL